MAAISCRCWTARRSRSLASESSFIDRVSYGKVRPAVFSACFQLRNMEGRNKSSGFDTKLRRRTRVCLRLAGPRVAGSRCGLSIFERIHAAPSFTSEVAEHARRFMPHGLIPCLAKLTHVDTSWSGLLRTIPDNHGQTKI